MTLLPPPFEDWFMTFFFVYVRVAGLVFTMPVISNSSVPRPVRTGIAFWVAMVVIGPVWSLNHAELAITMPPVARVYVGVVDFSIAVMAELGIGMALGFIGQMFLHTIGIAGEIIGQQAGFSAASVFDPITGQDIFLMAQINTWIGTLIFIVIDGPEKMFLVLMDSFRFFAPGEGFALSGLGTAGYEYLLYSEGKRQALASAMYTMGVQIAAPMIGSMILISIAEAFMARTTPQLNIMAVGFAIRISMSLLILLTVFEHTTFAYVDFLERYADYAFAFLHRLTTF
ncbi:MAG: hypothetical protein C4527_00325 [Candidatus Omnitrophota bacterium]|jgi:flagellar biosynthetic protein FliR|nr:MAG: hypothetical protein C4527_00325 [Candidatus Omnitrophota bacterium]